MAVTLEELFKSSPRREFRSSKANNFNKKVARNKTLLETIAHNGETSSCIEEDGTLKMKILVKKQDLKQILETMNVVSDNKHGRTSSSMSLSSSKLLASSLASIERRVHELARKRRGNQTSHHQEQRQSRSWTPALQSIPEEQL